MCTLRAWVSPKVVSGGWVETQCPERVSSSTTGACPIPSVPRGHPSRHDRGVDGSTKTFRSYTAIVTRIIQQTLNCLSTSVASTKWTPLLRSPTEDWRAGVLFFKAGVGAGDGLERGRKVPRDGDAGVGGATLNETLPVRPRRDDWNTKSVWTTDDSQSKSLPPVTLSALTMTKGGRSLPSEDERPV